MNDHAGRESACGEEIGNNESLGVALKAMVIGQGSQVVLAHEAQAIKLAQQLFVGGTQGVLLYPDVQQ